MYAKLLTLVGAFMLIGVVILCARHQRLQSAYRAATLHRAMTELEQTRWAVRGAIEDHCASQVLEANLDYQDDGWRALLQQDASPRDRR